MEMLEETKSTKSASVDRSNIHGHMYVKSLLDTPLHHMHPPSSPS